MNIKDKNVAVICKNQIDFCQCLKPSIVNSVFIMIDDKNKIQSNEFTDIILAPLAYENKDFFELLEMCKQRLIKEKKSGNKERKSGYYWVKYMGEWIICFYKNEWIHKDFNTYSDKYFEDICETPITRELFDKAIINEKLLEERQNLLDAIPECNIHGKCVFTITYNQI